MAIRIRKLTSDDLPQIEEMAENKLSATNTESHIFEDTSAKRVFRYFVLPENVYGSDKMSSFGYFDEYNNLLGILGLRNLDNNPAWILSFIVTSSDCTNSMAVIRSLMQYAIKYQENLGYFQWYVVSKLDRFKVWQKLFRGAREKYHHYVYARVPANTMPKWLGDLQYSGNKLFPYDINISMYMAKNLCTSEDPDSSEVNEQDIRFF